MKDLKVEPFRVAEAKLLCLLVAQLTHAKALKYYYYYRYQA